jgi:photosystem II stability/assembly factor-like uncharacterized protein
MAVNTIHLSGTNANTIYCGTDDGLYASSDHGHKWGRIFEGVGTEENSVLSILEVPAIRGLIFAGTGSGLFSTGDAGRSWSKVKGVPADINVHELIYDNGVIYALTGRGLYRGQNYGSSWKIIHEVPSDREDEYHGSGDDRIVREYEPVRGRSLTSLVVDPHDPQRLFMGTTDGLLVSEDGGRTWKSNRFAGITGADVRALAVSAGDAYTIYAATGDGLYCLDPETWDSIRLYKGLVSDDVQHVSVIGYPDRSYPVIVAATARGAYISSLPVTANSGNDGLSADEVLSMFSDEPTIGQLREAAIRYAEVHPDKIRKWRKAASRRAWLPDLHISFDRNRDWQSSTYFYSTTTQKYKDDDITKGKDYGWSVSLTWELGDLIWNDAQTSIDARSRLMVQLRDDIVNEVTRLYYERRRLQVKLLLNPEPNRIKRIEDELRLQELTASIDALTGSYLSQWSGGRRQEAGASHPN